jgi:predicted nucleic acid-binding protein
VVAIVLDCEAFAALADGRHRHNRRMMRYVEAARRLKRPVVIPTVILAEQYRGPARNALVDACLSREERALTLRNTDRDLARLVGSVLSADSAGSEHLADAHVVAAAIEATGGVVVTGDRGDLERLAGPYRFITVDSIQG